MISFEHSECPLTNVTAAERIDRGDNLIIANADQQIFKNLKMHIII